MYIIRSVYFLLVITLMLSGCQTSVSTRSDTTHNVSDGQELIVKGKVSLPAPAGYEKVWFNESSIIFSKAGGSIIYRWIDQEEIEFIGSKKSPYDFFKGAFNNPETVEEKGFLEGLSSSVKHLASSEKNLEMYSFDYDDGRQMYILSDSLDFVVEVTFKGDLNQYFEKLSQYSHIR
ncbi:MAG: hypothetical protein ACR2PX_14180 [Endozoicomonas sp.]|uniref:hypothetical protein n=1 Tax=Endozoicomonas sp. TaxID=1892382 RepID=UPI003D9AFF7E